MGHWWDVLEMVRSLYLAVMGGICPRSFGDFWVLSWSPIYNVSPGYFRGLPMCGVIVGGRAWEVVMPCRIVMRLGMLVVFSRVMGAESS